jgi:hypothetical protein
MPSPEAEEDSSPWAMFVAHMVVIVLAYAVLLMWTSFSVSECPKQQ